MNTQPDKAVHSSDWLWPRPMRVLVACEYSGRVREAFRARGHDAWSCDLIESDDDSPHHIVGDCVPLLTHGWDLLIAHPPCTYLSVSGMHWTARGMRDPKLTEDALDFVRLLMDAPIPRIAIENPVSVISSRIRKPDQIIQPWQHGHPESKATCLWLKGLPLLTPTKVMTAKLMCCGLELDESLGERGCPNCLGDKRATRRWDNQTASGQNKLPPSKDRWKIRSRTYQGIAAAMAEQWGATVGHNKPELSDATKGDDHE